MSAPVLDLMTGLSAVRRSAERVHQAASRHAPIGGVVISTHDGMRPPVAISVSVPAAHIAECLQVLAAEGPTLTGARYGERVLAPDLGSPTARDLWPAYVALMLRRSPYRAVFVFPLPLAGPLPGLLPGAGVATITLYQNDTTPLSPTAIEQIQRTSSGLHDTVNACAPTGCARATRPS